MSAGDKKIVITEELKGRCSKLQKGKNKCLKSDVNQIVTLETVTSLLEKKDQSR